MNVTLDALDERLVRALIDDGRASFDRLGERVGLSPSAVLRRVRRLEQQGVIRGYTARVAPESLGAGLTAYLNVSLEKHVAGAKHSPAEAFHAAVLTWPEVIECAALTGEMDYLLQVAVRDMPHYARFITDTVLRHPSVRDCRSSFVIQRIKDAHQAAL